MMYSKCVAVYFMRCAFCVVLVQHNMVLLPGNIPRSRENQAGYKYKSPAPAKTTKIHNTQYF
jgi:hypothetical protein